MIWVVISSQAIKQQLLQLSSEGGFLLETYHFREERGNFVLNEAEWQFKGLFLGTAQSLDWVTTFWVKFLQSIRLFQGIQWIVGAQLSSQLMETGGLHSE